LLTIQAVSNIGFQILGNDDASIIVSAGPSPSQVYVDDDYTNSTPGWGYDHFATIQEGIDAVAAGGIVIVFSGTYNENIVINKALTLRGDSYPIIDGGAVGDCISVGADNVIIDGFEIRNGYNGIIGQTSNSVFSNNVIHDNLNILGYAGVGILLWGDNDDNIIMGNEIYDNDRQGIFIGYQDDSKISSGNLIDNNIIYNNGLYRYENGPDASAYGIQLWCADDNTIRNNEVYNHDDWFPYPDTYPEFDFAQGIYLCDSNNNTVTNNFLHDNNYGIGLWHPVRSLENNYINYNNITGNTGYGIRNYDTIPIDARFNWWGDASGPYHETSWMYMGSPYGPHYGLGDNVTDYVLYYPWLSEPSGPPVEPPTASFVPSTNRARINEIITFDASSSMPNGGYITNYIWDFGDGNVASTSDPMITHSYDAQGTYNVSLTVEDNEGLEDSTWQIVKVGPPALLKVEPTIIQAQMINKTFTINVTISDLWEDWNVVGVQFRLGYNSTLLEVVNVTEGPFMKNFGDTFFTYVIEEPAYGYPAHILIGIVLLPPWTDFPYGDGALVTITFKIIYQEKVLDPEATPPLTCSLMLFDVRDLFLVDYEQERIPCNLEHGLYEIYSNHIADVNWDYYVGIDDITYAAEHFGSDPETWPERWDPECDVTGDNYVGIDDIVLIASSFGWTPTYDP
jgi:parallel beta-helix repeat protein